MDEDTMKFLAELEQRHGGSIQWRTYATWFGANDGTIREYGVFVFIINNRFYFEDFERVPMLLGYRLKQKKGTPAYEKYEGCFNPTHIKRTMVVTKSKANDCILGATDVRNIKPAGPIAKLFKQLVMLVELDTGTSYFFEFMDRKRFLQEVDKSLH